MNGLGADVVVDYHEQNIDTLGNHTAYVDDGFQWPDASEILFMCHILDCHKRSRNSSVGKVSRSEGSSGAPALHSVPVGTALDFQRAHCPCNLSGSGVNFVVDDFTVCVFLGLY